MVCSHIKGINIDFISIMKMLTLDKNDLVIIINVISNVNEGLTLPQRYRDYTNVFNKTVVTTLSESKPKLNHKILLKPNSTPSYELLYNLSETELKVL